MKGLQWTTSPPLNRWTDRRIQRIRELILETTGETYNIDRLRSLPLDKRFGLWVLTDGERDKGLLWAMCLSKSRVRVLAFSVADELQGQGYGSEGWRKFAIHAKSSGMSSVQLEVRQDNDSAIRLYRRRGLKPQGYISGFYRDNDGWVMTGHLRANPSSQ